MIDMIFVAINTMVSRIWMNEFLATLEESEIVSPTALCFNLVCILVTSETMILLTGLERNALDAKRENKVLHRLAKHFIHESDDAVPLHDCAGTSGGYAVVQMVKSDKEEKPGEDFIDAEKAAASI